MSLSHTSGWYIDSGGRKWCCVSDSRGMQCNSNDGYYTSVFHSTFAAWGWKPTEAPARRALAEQDKP